MAIISGTLRQLHLYKHVGFVPFGPIVGTGEAQFQPMYLPLATLVRISRAVLRSTAEGIRLSASYHVGPVEVQAEGCNARRFRKWLSPVATAQFWKIIYVDVNLICKLLYQRLKFDGDLIIP